jgi:phosphoserine phosphatase
MIKQCNISVNALNAINHRNGLVSFRFNASTKDLNKSRETLAQFALTNSIEAALLENAPLLASPGLLVMDMDSTTIEIECIDEIAILAGVGEQVAAVTELAMQGKLDFAQSLHQRVSTLKDAPEQILADVAKDIPLMAGLKTLIEQLKQHDWRIAIASGGFTYFAEHLEKMLGLDASFANKLEIVNGKLTGKVLGDVVDAQAKADSLAILSKQYNIAKNQTVAMGDGANDLVMMAAAYLGVAYHAKPIVLAQSDSSINHSGLDCLLHWLK